MKLLYQGPLWLGSTSLQRLNAFEKLDTVTALSLDSGARIREPNYWNRIRWKLRWPADTCLENRRLLEAVEQETPDVVFVDNSKVIGRQTLADLRRVGVRKAIYYSPDDIIARHNLSMPLRCSLPHWDIVFTTKTFNVSELEALGVAKAILVGKAYDPEVHFPLYAGDVGEDYERFDVVFVGSYEKERCSSINALAETGVAMLVYGAAKGGWRKEQLHPSITLRQAVYGDAYRVAWHTGKVALCFLKKVNRDRITQRTMEIAAMGRPMVAEKTDEHDEHFVDGSEYLGFRNDLELISRVMLLLRDGQRRDALGRSGRDRCLNSGYSNLERAREMLSAIEQLP